MVRKLMVAPLAALVLAWTAPQAVAAPPVSYGCRILNAQDSTLTGRNFEGVAVGYAVSSDAGTISVHCEVEINGQVAPAAVTPTGTGPGVALTASPVAYESSDGDDVELCVVVAWDSGSLRECEDTFLYEVPPREVIDVVADIAFPAYAFCGSLGLSPCASPTCLVNTGECAGGFCVVNTGYCGPGCFAVVNTGSCGRPPQVDPGGAGKILPI